jgi:hypothetical protein
MKVHVKATTVNMKTGGVNVGVYIVNTNGFMFIRESLKTQIGKNERVEHVEVMF